MPYESPWSSRARQNPLRPPAAPAPDEIFAHIRASIPPPSSPRSTRAWAMSPHRDVVRTTCDTARDPPGNAVPLRGLRDSTPRCASPVPPRYPETPRSAPGRPEFAAPVPSCCSAPPPPPSKNPLRRPHSSRRPHLASPPRSFAHRASLFPGSIPTIGRMQHAHSFLSRGSQRAGGPETE